MKNKYDEVRNKHQKMFDSFPLMFAFSNEQFEQQMKEHGLDPKDTDKIVSIGGGGFIKKEDVNAYNKMRETSRKEHNTLIESDKSGDGYRKDMFVSELNNHEYSYTHELDETLDALGLTYEEIMKSPSLKYGLELARKEVLEKSNSMEDYAL